MNGIIVSYSELNKWDTCPRQYYYRFGLGLQPVEESQAITTGGKGHKLLQTFYEGLREGLTKEQALAAVQLKAKKIMSEEKVGDFGLAYAWTLVDNYIRATDFTSKAVLVENRFLFPASFLTDDPDLAEVQIGFTPDVVFERTGGFCDVEDSKFIQRDWGTKKINRAQQNKLYHVFLKRMGYNVSRSTLRFFNVTTSNITAKNYTMTPIQEEILINDFIWGIKDMLKFKLLPLEVQSKARRTMQHGVCQFCAFEYVCGLESEGKDASKTIKNLFIKSKYDYRS